MPPPNPDRPLLLAVRVARLFGLLMVMIGAFWLLPLFFTNTRARPQFTIMQLLGALLLLIPGIGYVLLAIALRRRHLWAAVSTIVLSGIQAAFMFYVAYALWHDLQRGPYPNYLRFILFVVVLLAGSVTQLIVFTAKALPAIRNPPIDEVRGFELVTKDVTKS